MKLRKNLKLGTIVGCTAIGVCSTALSAEEPTKGKTSEVIETITVTAERQSQSIQKLPASIQAFSAEDLASSGTQSITDLQNLIPGLVMNDRGGIGNVYMRGIGTDVYGAGIEAGVAVYVDGVYQSRPTGTLFQFVDVERIEAMKGPQGVLYGRNATGGAINIISQAPSKVNEGQFDAQLGNYNERIVRGTFSGPLSDGVAYGRLSVLSNNNDGFTRNILLNTRDTTDIKSVRGSLELIPNTLLNIRINAHYYDADHPNFLKSLGGLQYDLMGAERISDPYTISADLLGIGQNRQSGLDATVKFDLGWAKLTSITAIKQDKWKTSTDVDATEVGFLHLGAPNPSSDDTKFFSQDFTLVSSKKGPLEWTALASYMHQKIDTQFNFAIPAFGVVQLTNANITTDSSGVGGQASYSFDNGVKLTAGARYSSDTKKIDETNFANGATVATQKEEKTWSAWTPKIVADYSPTKETMYFASITKGFKGGGYDTVVVQKPFSPEHVTNYEAGIKSTLLNGRLRFNASIFSMDYKDLQVQVVQQLAGGAVFTEIKNAAKATINGVEIGVVAKPAARVELSGNLQLMRARFDDFPTFDQMRPTLGAINLKDNPLPNAPDTSLNLAAQYIWPSAVERTDIILRVDAAYRSKMYYDAYRSDGTKDDPFTLWNAHLRFEPNGDKGVYGAIFVKNITNKRHNIYMQEAPLIHIELLAPPRTFGVQVGYRY